MIPNLDPFKLCRLEFYGVLRRLLRAVAETPGLGQGGIDDLSCGIYPNDSEIKKGKNHGNAARYPAVSLFNENEALPRSQSPAEGKALHLAEEAVAPACPLYEHLAALHVDNLSISASHQARSIEIEPPRRKGDGQAVHEAMRKPTAC